MAKFDGDIVTAEFEKAFGMDRNNITPAMVLFMVRFAKNVRFRCRSNTALNNMLARSFPTMRFTTETRTWNGKNWEALVVNVKDQAKSGPMVEEPEED